MWSVIFSNLGPWGVFFTTQSIFCMFFLLSILWLFGGSASFYWNNCAQWLGRTPAKTRIQVWSVTLPSMGPIMSQYIFLMSTSRNLFTFYQSFLWVTSYFLERNMLTSYIGPLTQTRIGVSSVAVPSMGPMRGQYVFHIPKSRNLYTFSIFSYNL